MITANPSQEVAKIEETTTSDKESQLVMGNQPTLEQVNEELLSKFELLRIHFNSKASNAKILSKLQETGCLLRCTNDIRSTSYDNIQSFICRKT